MYKSSIRVGTQDFGTYRVCTKPSLNAMLMYPAKLDIIIIIYIGQRFQLYQYIIYASSEYSGEYVHLLRLAGGFYARHCDNNQILAYWLVYFCEIQPNCIL